MPATQDHCGTSFAKLACNGGTRCPPIHTWTTSWHVTWQAGLGIGSCNWSRRSYCTSSRDGATLYTLLIAFCASSTHQPAVLAQMATCPQKPSAEITRYVSRVLAQSTQRKGCYSPCIPEKIVAHSTHIASIRTAQDHLDHISMSRGKPY